eukprot:jgi/Mesen1/4403/ME000225S03396
MGTRSVMVHAGTRYDDTFHEKIVLGIDFGGTGIKGSLVELATGKLLEERVRIPTPDPATPEAVAEVIKQLKDAFQWDGLIGVGMPSVVRNGIVRSAANIDKSWINIDAKELYERVTGCQVAVLNDADAALEAEMEFGAGRDFRQEGVVLLCTIGTGLGTAMFVNGTLVPNLELGHIEMEGVEAERYASDRVREKEELSWKKWAARLSGFLGRLEQYLQPDLIILGGGVSKKDDKFLPMVSIPGGTPVVPAKLQNEAGIVGAAVGAADLLKRLEVVKAAREARAAAKEGSRDLTPILAAVGGAGGESSGLRPVEGGEGARDLSASEQGRGGEELLSTAPAGKEITGVSDVERARSTMKIQWPGFGDGKFEGS